MSTAAFPALLGVYAAASAPPQPDPGVLIANGALLAPLTLLRAQVSSRATGLAADDATLQIFGADVPRFAGSASRLMVEGQRTNDIPDPFGFAAGSGWNALSGGTGSAPVITPGYGAIAAPDGSFTATLLQLNKGAGTSSADQSGLSRNTSTSAARFVWVRTLTGTATVQIGTNGTAAGVQSSVDTTWRRLGVAAGGGVHRIMLNGAAGSSASAQLLVWGASSEASATFPSSLVLPPVGASQVSTRGADLVAASLAALGIAGSGACTVLWSGRLPQISTNAAQTILQVDDGTISQRWVCDGQPTGSNIRIFGSNATTLSVGVATAGAPLRVGVAINGAGRAAACLNGGAVVATTGGPTGGLTTLRLGSNHAGGLGMFGETAYLRVLPTVLSDADLPAAVNALPG
jgi:hypothetical protein